WDDFTHALVIQWAHPTLPPLIASIAGQGQISQASALALIMLLPAAIVVAMLSRMLVHSRGLTLEER
ncbi:hypothetical protein JXA47_06405, partial [Candidatus Sumerlaeota bacterium]|nr:hypothetical protein [Candidatus Sumerlaeota bacterium]